LNADSGGAGGGSIDTPAAGRSFVAFNVAVPVLVIDVVDMPCDTSPGGLFKTITPRSTYNTNTPGLPRASEARAVRVDCAARVRPRRAFTDPELRLPSSNPIGSLSPRCALAECGMAVVVSRSETCRQKKKKRKKPRLVFELVCRKNLAPDHERYFKKCYVEIEIII
jgi:hypothetical protein